MAIIDKKERLWIEYSNTKSSAVREQIIIEYVPLVKVVAGRLAIYLGSNVEYEDLVAEIKKHIPNFTIDYAPDFRQAIADSWPSSIDDSVAKADWGFAPKFDIDKMTTTMLENLKVKLVKA